MNNPNVEKVTSLLHFFCKDGPWLCNVAPKIAESLDGNGLLVTPLHERALKACERIVESRPVFGSVSLEDRIRQPLTEAVRIGEESLAAKKPKERYVAMVGVLACGVKDTTTGGMFLAGNSLRETLTEQQARAVAAALNALEGK